tara:strand:- start:5046 stop:5624 length:579 start_codon:yes stop_codon:yes gene_type:complete
MVLDKKTRAFLHSKPTLMFVTGIASLTVIGLLSSDDGDSAAFMVMTGLIVSFFTENMIIILVSSILAAISYSGLDIKKSVRKRGLYREGFEGEVSREKKGLKDDDVAGPLKGGESVEATIANLEEILGSGSVDTMSATTKKLLTQQNALGKKLEDIMPLVQQGMGMLDKVGGTEGINKMLETLEKFTPNKQS